MRCAKNTFTELRNEVSRQTFNGAFRAIFSSAKRITGPIRKGLPDREYYLSTLAIATGRFISNLRKLDAGVSVNKMALETAPVANKQLAHIIIFYRI